MQTNDERARDLDQATDGATPQYDSSEATAQSVDLRGQGEDRSHEDLHAARTSEHSHAAALPHKKSGRGMSGRRRIGLKIEPDESGAHGPTKKRSDAHDGHEKEAQLRPLGLTGDSSSASGGGEEWWKLEYRAPRPGHLGAHVIARDEEHNSPLCRRNPSAIPDAAGNATPPTPSRALSSSSTTDRPHLHETPERARKVRGGSELYDATTSHSSPNPKRKIMDLQDVEAGTFPLMGVAKEPKRFHETNGELQHVEGESELARTLRAAVVTPSKLLRSMKKIDIQAGSAPATTTATAASGQKPLEKQSSCLAATAPESA